MTAPRELRLPGHGVELQAYEWPGAGPAVLLVHATGFHSRCWDQVVARLRGRHVFAIDMRGHGRSEKPPPPYDWRFFGLDVAAAVRELGLRGAVAVGHSKGGHAVTTAAAEAPGAFGALLLLDPVILPREAYARTGLQQGEHFAARRRDRWTSPDEMFQRFKDRPPFSLWDPAVLRDYCDYGLLPAPDGDGYTLACPPAIEAAVYAGSAGTDIYEAIERIDLPVRVVRARSRAEATTTDMASSPTAPDLASKFARGEDVFLPEMTHFIPMQDPGLVAAHIEDMIRRYSGETASDS